MQDIQSEIQQNQLVVLLLEAIGDGIFILDAHGKIIAWNKAMEKITGYMVDEVRGQGCSFLNFSQCFEKDCPTSLKDCGILEYGRVEPTECILTDKLGHPLSVIKNARVIKDNQGKILGIVEAVTDLTELKKTRIKMEEATRRLSEINRLQGIIGRSRVMQNVFSFIKASAMTDAAILIQGETGTGKELVARAIHSISNRSDHPMITVNCSALPESLLESELFGHVKGAYTGAIQDRVGRFEEAGCGTIFLDEIGEITPYIQIKLLRVLQQKEIERVGESRKRKIDIRIITATNKDLKSLVEDEKFREDLYYRLKVFPIYLPPLRDRKDDIPLLVNHFIRLNNETSTGNVKGMTKSALKAFFDYNWPGNIRELANAIEHAFVLCSDREIDLEDLPIEIKHMHIKTSSGGQEGMSSILKPARMGSRLTRGRLLELLYSSNWNKAEVARRTGYSRASIWKYMKKWDIPLKE